MIYLIEIIVVSCPVSHIELSVTIEEIVYLVQHVFMAFIGDYHIFLLMKLLTGLKVRLCRLQFTMDYWQLFIRREC